MTDAKPFIALLRRVSRSRYSALIMNNRMIMQCYNLDVDSDVGLHYILPIPDTSDYQDEFYDQTFIFSPSAILSVYSAAHKEMDAKRKEEKYKPKDLKEEVCLVDNTLKFIYQIADETPISTTVPVIIPDDTNADISNILKHYEKLITWIKPGGVCINMDGTYRNLQSTVVDTPEIMFYILKYAGKRVRVPLYKSLFVGIKDLDFFRFNIQETIIDEVYVNTIHISKGGIEEIFWGYILNY